MNILDYIQKKEDLKNSAPQYRSICPRCVQPSFGCYCHKVHSFDSNINFVILIHPIEVQRRIATGRMSHLCLQNSYLIEGQDYTHNPLVNHLVSDPNYFPVILYPGQNSTNLTELSYSEKTSKFSTSKKLRIFVIDGTWATAKKMIRQSENLKHLPRVCFTSPKPSTFRVRKQPREGCYSTIEAIHHSIELLGETQGFELKNRAHDNLLEVFDYMVERQLEFIRISNENPKASTYRREGQKKISLALNTAKKKDPEHLVRDP